MAQIHPIRAVCYAAPDGGDVSSLIAPPYDVLDERSKAALLERSSQNIAAVDLPHLPPKTVGPDRTYEEAGRRFTHWLETGVLQQRHQRCFYVYRQTFTVANRHHQRVGLVANVTLSQPAAAGPDGSRIYAHERTFGPPREDRVKLMRATGTQISPLWALYRDTDGAGGHLLRSIAEQGPPLLTATTGHDQVRHEVWAAPDLTEAFRKVLAGRDLFIADGHHRYSAALTYLADLGPDLAPDHPARSAMFVLVAMEDPGLLVLPTHRALGQMRSFSFEAFATAARDHLAIRPFVGSSLEVLALALPGAGLHAMGLCWRQDRGLELALATSHDEDPLASISPKRDPAWRQLDVAIVQQLVVDRICQPNFCAPGQTVQWQFTHDLTRLASLLAGDDVQLGIVLQPIALDAVQQVCEAGELMPPKSTFFYPKLATGLLMHSLADQPAT